MQANHRKPEFPRERKKEREREEESGRGRERVACSLALSLSLTVISHDWPITSSRKVTASKREREVGGGVRKLVCK